MQRLFLDLKMYYLIEKYINPAVIPLYKGYQYTDLYCHNMMHI